MKLYNVEVVETLTRVVEQKANSYEEAEELVSAKYSDSEIVLDWNDLEDISYKPYPSQELKKDFLVTFQFKKDKNELLVTDNKGTMNYSCKNTQDLELLLKNYIDNNVELEDVVPEKNIKNKDYER